MNTDIKSLVCDDLAAVLSEKNLPKFRAKQIFMWLHKYAVNSFDDMTNLPKPLRDTLKNEFYISSCGIEKKYVSKIDGTVKYLFKLCDHEYIESVVMKYKHGYTICVSSQVGCKMGCTFCASTLAGFKRNLTPGEIESQIHSAQQDLGIRVSNVVMMGIGEPLDNYENVLRFINIINDENALHISMRNITVSTCGIVDKIYDLMKEKLQITLTISLHATTDKVRSKTMPINNKWGIEELINACRDYVQYTGRRISFEYTLISGVNDSAEDAINLAQLLDGIMCHVNLIPVNNVEERENIRCSDENVIKFQKSLKRCGINATIRRTLGHDINASCGQLRRLKKRGDHIENSR